MLLSRSLAGFAVAALSACGYADNEHPTADLAVAPANAGQSQVASGLSFVESECSGCHAIRPGIESPNPQAPTFEAVANDMDFDQETLREFFLDGHDVPFAMTILLEEDEAEIASAYIMSLRTPR